MKTCVQPGCRETQLHKNVICSYVRRNARGTAWTEIDSHRWIRVVVQKKKKKKNYESQSSRMSRIETLVGFHLERARVCV